LAGDIEAAGGAQLLQTSLDEPVDWLLVPHHGSKTSSTESWVNTLRPRWAVVQAGYRNRFGHPVAAGGAALSGGGASWWLRMAAAQPTGTLLNLELECER
jgi:beta-lactamase superfamily II metal-dependent hydrolase